MKQGVARFPADAALYIRPMYWAESGYGGGVRFDPETTTTVPVDLCRADAGALGRARHALPFTRPTADSAPLEAKAGCLYPNGARARRRPQRGASAIA